MLIGRLALATAGLLLAGTPLSAQRRDADTLPSAVVQRFVDAVNARDMPSAIATVAPEAVFSVFPSGKLIAVGQDSIRSFYAAMFSQLKPGFTVNVARRIHDGGFVIDHEVFHEKGAQAPTGQATWVYWVVGGLIRHAWTLKPPPQGP